MATVGKAETHETVLGLDEGGESGEAASNVSKLKSLIQLLGRTWPSIKMKPG
jgi:hypothetical protein